MKRKILALFLASTMIFSSISNVFANNNAVSPVLVSSKAAGSPAKSATGNLKTTLNFTAPELVEVAKSKNITFTLLKDNVAVGSTILNASTKGASIGKYKADISLKNTDNVEITNELEIGSIDVNISGVPLGKYKVKLSGEGYRTYTSEEIVIDKYSKHIVLNTGDRTFTIGDANNDNVINSDDLRILEKNLNTNDPKYDLNKDGVVNIVDLALVNHHIETYGDAGIYEYEIIPQAIVDTDILKKELDRDTNITVKGSIDDIFKEGASVKFENKSGAVTAENPISIPVPFSEPIEMEQLEIRAPGGEGSPESGKVEVTYIDENGKEVTETKPFTSELTASLSRNPDIHFLTKNGSENTITVNLGKRVAVKKATVRVEKVTSSSGKTSYVSIEEIKFLKDVVPDVPTDYLIVKNVDVTELNESLNLTWAPIPNVSGYKVYYWTKRQPAEKILTVKTNSATLTDLKNLETSYFKIAPISDNWEGEKSPEFSGTPQPSSLPLKPDFLKVVPGEGSLTVSWKKAENASAYNVYYKKSTDPDFKKAVTNTTSLSHTIYGLQNDVEHTIYVTGTNKIGEGARSIEVVGIPEKVIVEPPVIPTKNKLSKDNIEKIELAHPDYYDHNMYPKMDISWVADDDYNTHWVARAWWETNSLTFTFVQPKDMNHLVYSARLDGNFRKSLSTYNITVWLENDDLTKPGRKIIESKPIPSNTSEAKGYVVLPFPKQEKVKKLSVQLAIWNSAPTNVSASEVVFYEYYDVNERVKALFKNKIFTELADGVTEKQIDEIIKEVTDEDGYYVNKATLLDELNLAKKLLAKDPNALGLVKDKIYAIDGSNDVSRVNEFIPLGVSAPAGSTVVVYADIPEGETVSVIPTQHYSEASALTGAPITLTSGRNEIEVPKIGNLKQNISGGALYLSYKGTRGDEIKLHVRGGTKIPVLELHDWASLSEEQRKASISKYIEDLTAYVPTITGDKTLSPLNGTEISLPNVLLSLPADKVLQGVESGVSSPEQKIDKLYANALAWEDFFTVVHTVHGLDNPLTDLKSRQNIRAMRMFGTAFMYAAGNHIGIGFGSVGGLVQGKPVSETAASGDGASNSLFGWGIAHEVGHVLDRLGKAEITNNIYSLFVQTYDGQNNDQISSRVSTKYPDVFNLVADSRAGETNDVFKALSMYWQLHLAYDGGKGDPDRGPFYFYNKVHKLLRAGEGSGEDLANKFALVASKAAEKNLTEFFTRWGYKLSPSTLATLAALPEETRKIHYLNETSRAKRIANYNVPSGNTVTATIQRDSSNPRESIITATSSISAENIQGYEILKNGKSIGFTTTGTYTDITGAANNTAITYSVNAIDILGNPAGSIALDEFRLEYDSVLDSSLYNITKPTATETLATMTSQQIVTGIKLTATDAPTADTPNAAAPKAAAVQGSDPTIKIEVKKDGSTEFVVAKEGLLSEINSSKDKTKALVYLSKPGTTDTRIWPYDAIEVKVTGLPEGVKLELLSYPGDNIEFSDYAIGKLKNDYVYSGENGDETIPAGTLVITGNYRGDPYYNTILVQGKFIESNHNTPDDNGNENLQDQVVERPIAGYGLLFSEIFDGNAVSDTSDGFFIYVPDVQAESELQGVPCDAVSILPIQIKAELYRTENGTDSETKRLTSNTVWINTPSYESMPSIELVSTP